MSLNPDLVDALMTLGIDIRGLEDRALASNPHLDDMVALDAYVSGYINGALAGMQQGKLLMLGVISQDEASARIFGPDAFASVAPKRH